MFDRMMRNLSTFLTLLLFPLLSWAQGGTSCFDAREINVPLAQNDFALENKHRQDDLDINLVYYQEEDTYTFWYKLNVTQDCLLGFRVASTNADDDYDFILYQYNGENFCDTLKKRPLVPVSNNVYEIERPGDPPFSSGTAATYQNAMEMKAGNTYYLTVLSLTPDDCGHKLFMTTGNESLIISAVHNPCFQFNQPKIADASHGGDLPADVTIEGVVRDQNSNEVIAAEIAIIDEGTGEVINLQSDMVTGYKTTLKRNYTYKLECSSFGYEPIYGVIEFYNSTVYNFYLPKLKPGNNVVMENIYFHPNTYAFKQQSGTELEKLWNFLKMNPSVQIEIHGHTAANTPVREVRPSYQGKGPEWTYTGSARKLSKLRAQAVKDYLVKNGITANRIETKGFGGDDNMIPHPRSPEEKSRNMRVEVQIIDIGE